jgi:hypothetical protein
MKTFTYTDYDDYYGSYHTIIYYECDEEVHTFWRLYELQDLGLLQIVGEEVYHFEGVWNPQTATRIR